ncbi:MAG: Rossmann-like and DUF2520 domain-containing protein [Actinomycetes bacterium]
MTDPLSPADRPARLGVGVVGAGRVGAVLGAALARSGHTVVAASGVSVSSRRRIEELLPGVPVVSPYDVLERAELVLLTVPEQELPEIVRGAAAAQAIPPGQLLVHTSGRYGVGVLEPATRVGALPLALHPVLTFTGTAVDLARLTGVTFGVTTLAPLRPAAEALVLEMGGEPEWVDEERRPLYHAALTGGASHLVTLVAETQELLRRAGVQEPGRMLGPLLGAALDQGLRAGDLGLTGPASLADAETVAAHVRELGRVSPTSQRAYVALARLTADRALAVGRLSTEQAAALLDALSERG